MTNEQRYELAVNMLRAYDAETGNTAADRIIKNPHEWTADTGFFPVYRAAALLLIEAKQGMDKATGGAGRTAALNRIYKEARANSRKSLHGCFRSGDKWAVCDGHRAVRLNTKPESIPEAEGDPLDLEKCIPEESRYSEAVQLPSVGEIKAHMAEHKRKSKRGVSYESIEALPGWWCNPQYLLDMLAALPGGTAHKPKNAMSPLYYESGDGDALLLPVRPPYRAEAAA